MGLETGTYLNDLVTTNPVHATDSKSEGDDHLRLIKSVLKNTFPGWDQEALRKNAGEMVLNESGADLNFRVEGVSEANGLFYDAANNRLGLGTAAPSGQLHMVSSNPAIVLDDSDASGTVAISQLTGLLYFNIDPTNVDASSTMRVDLDGTQWMTLNTTGLGIGTIPSVLLHLGSAAPLLRWDDTDATGVADMYQTIGTLVLSVDPGNVDASSQLQIHVDNAQKVAVEAASMTVNPLGADYDFIVESDNNANMLHVDASVDCVAIGTASPTASASVDVVPHGLSNPAFTIYDNGNVRAGNGTGAALLGSATTGFFYLPAIQTTPSGTPATIAGFMPIVIDAANAKLYYRGSTGGWKEVATV